jgi:hypothetical protein
MPEGLDNYGAEDTQENGFEEVNFDEIEEKLNAKMDDGFQKLILKTNTNAIVKSAKLTRATAPKKDSKDKEYYDMILRVTCEVEGQKDKDGNPVETMDNYGGLREYNDGFWSGNKSAFGKLRQKMKDEFDVVTYSDMLRTVQGKDVKIKTETSTFNGKEFQKNIIQSFR